MADEYVPASGLTYTPDDVRAFVTYIYAEYWADDLLHDRFVPTSCIQKHFSEQVAWTFGGMTSNSRAPLVGRYEGHSGMARFLDAFGSTFKVHKWEGRLLGLEASDDGQVDVCVALEARYEVRATGAHVCLEELHHLTISSDGEGEPRITSVRILFDQPALEAALALAAPAPAPAPTAAKLTKAQRVLGAEAPAAPPATATKGTDPRGGDELTRAPSLISAVITAVVIAAGAVMIQLASHVP